MAKTYRFKDTYIYICSWKFTSSYLAKKGFKDLHPKCLTTICEIYVLVFQLPWILRVKYTYVRRHRKRPVAKNWVKYGVWYFVWYLIETEACCAWKVSVFGVILFCIFSHSDWIRRDNPYFSVFSPNAEKCGSG